MVKTRTYWSDLHRGATEILGRPLNEEEARRFERYLALLIEWNRVHRMIGSSDPTWVVDNVLLDSLLFLRVLPRRAHSLADLGSGAGIPGIPLKIIAPEMQLTLIEPRRRRVSFLSTVVRELSLTGVQILPVRAEDVLRQGSPEFDHVVMRCAGRLDDVLDLALRLVAPGGLVIAAGSPKARGGLGGQGRQITVPGVTPKGLRTFIVCEKRR